MRLKMRCERPHSRVPIDEMSLVVDEQRSVGIAIKCDTQVGVFVDYSLTKRINVKRPAIAIDVASIRRRIDGEHFRTEACE